MEAPDALRRIKCDLSPRTGGILRYAKCSRVLRSAPMYSKMLRILEVCEWLGMIRISSVVVILINSEATIKALYPVATFFMANCRGS